MGAGGWWCFESDLVTDRLPGGQARPRQWDQARWRFQDEALGFYLF